MKTRHKRLAIIITAVVGLSVAALFGLNAYKDNLVFFYSPTDIAEGKAPAGKTFRLGGMVKNGSIKRGENLEVSFIVTDNHKEVAVHYKGILPDLFREGQGVVAQGKFNATKTFEAAEVLAKHDENYMPPEAARAMKQGEEKAGKAAQTGAKSAPETKARP